MIPVVPCLHRFNCHITQIVGLICTVHKRVCVGNDPAILIAVPDQVHCIMILMPVRYQNQIGCQIISFTRVRINVDDLAFTRDNSEAAMSLVQEPMFGSSFGDGCTDACHEHGEGQ